MMDVFATTQAAANLPLPKDRVIDGIDIFPLLTSKATTPHEALFSLSVNRLKTVCGGRWKLHGHPSDQPCVLKPGEPWEDKNSPDGVTILAPCEQAHPSQYPDVLTGDAVKAGSLFDLAADPAEQHDVAEQHSGVVNRLWELLDQMERQMQRPELPPEKYLTK